MSSKLTWIVGILFVLYLFSVLMGLWQGVKFAELCKEQGGSVMGYRNSLCVIDGRIVDAL